LTGIDSEETAQLIQDISKRVSLLSIKYWGQSEKDEVYFGQRQLHIGRELDGSTVVDGSTVLELLPHHPKVKGLCPAPWMTKIFKKDKVVVYRYIKL